MTKTKDGKKVNLVPRALPLEKVRERGCKQVEFAKPTNPFYCVGTRALKWNLNKFRPRTAAPNGGSRLRRKKVFLEQTVWKKPRFRRKIQISACLILILFLLTSLNLVSQYAVISLSPPPSTQYLYIFTWKSRIPITSNRTCFIFCEPEAGSSMIDSFLLCRFYKFAHSAITLVRKCMTTLYKTDFF